MSNILRTRFFDSGNVHRSRVLSGSKLSNLLLPGKLFASSIRFQDMMGIPKEKLIFKVGHSFLFIRPEEILYIKVFSNALRLYTNKTIFRLSLPIRILEERLSEYANFVRISRSTIVNLDCVLRIEPETTKKRYTVILNNGTHLGLTRKSALKVIMHRSDIVSKGKEKQFVSGDTEE